AEAANTAVTTPMKIQPGSQSMRPAGTNTSATSVSGEHISSSTETARDICAGSVAAIGFLSSFALAPRRSVNDGLEPRTVAGIHLFNHSFRGFHRERPVS